MQLALGLSLQVISCTCCAIGLAFMKLSSELDGDRVMCLRWRWWLGFAFLAVLATTVEGYVLTLVPLTIVAPFAGLTILLSMLIAATGCISARVALTTADGWGGALTIVGVGLVSFFGPSGAQAEESLSFAAVLRALADPQFLLFISATLVSVGAWLCIVLAPPLRRIRALADAANLSTAFSAYAAAVCGALSQTFLKCVSVGISYSLTLPSLGASLREVWLLPQMWSVFAGLAVCAPLQLYLIDIW